MAASGGWRRVDENPGGLSVKNMLPTTVITFARNGAANFEYVAAQVPEAFRRKLILATDNYWFPGMLDWRSAAELEALVTKMNSMTDAERKAEKAVVAKGGMVVVTTTPSVQGYRVAQYLGITRGIVVRTPNLLEGLSGGIDVIIGRGRVSAYAEMCEKTRQEAYDAMLVDARAKGANAIIGVAYDANEVMEKCTEVLCYGTAVVLVKE